MQISDYKYLKVSSARTNSEETNHQNDQMVEVKRDNMLIGDIIKLRRGEVAPTDILILSASDQGKSNSVVKVDSFVNNGASLTEIKEPLSVLKNFEFQDANFKPYLKRLNAKLQYYRCHRDSGKVFGTFKYSTDPRGESFSNEKVVFQGSVLQSEFAVGLVLFNGRKCLPRELRTVSSLWKHTKMSEVQQKQSTFAVLVTILGLIACFYSKLASNRAHVFITPDLNGIAQTTSFSTYFSLYFSCMTISINTTLNLACWLMSILLQRDFLEAPTAGSQESLPPIEEEGKGNKNLKILAKPKVASHETPAKTLGLEVFDPWVLPDLGDIDDIAFDKSGTLVDHKYQVVTIATKTQFYHANKDPGFLIDHSQIEILDVSDISPEVVFGDSAPGVVAGDGAKTESKKVILVNMEDKKQVLSGMGSVPNKVTSEPMFRFDQPGGQDPDLEAGGKKLPLSQEYKSSKFTTRPQNLGTRSQAIGWSEIPTGPLLMTTEAAIPSSVLAPGLMLPEQTAEGKIPSSSNFADYISKKESVRPPPITADIQFDKKSEPSNERSPKSYVGAKGDQIMMTPSSRMKKADSASPFRIELTSAKQDEVVSIEEGFLGENAQSPDNLVKGAMHFLHEYKTREISELLTMFALCQDAKTIDGRYDYQLTQTTE